MPRTVNDVKTFDNKPASTEGFKTIVEKHMSKSMDLGGNHTMDWFFNEYVYGMGEPQYVFRATTQVTPDGKQTHLTGTLTRSGVADNWKDAVPLYAHVGDRTIKMGILAMTHPTETIDVTVGGKVDRVSINDFEDLLAEVKQ